MAPGCQRLATVDRQLRRDIRIGRIIGVDMTRGARSHLVAGSVGLVDDADEGFAALVFSGEGGQFEVQRAKEFDTDDVALGIATYCLVVNAGPTFYGGVEHWSLDDTNLTLDVSAEAARKLGLDSQIRIRIEDDTVSPEDIRSFLAELFDE